jgi:hypothetical protein
VTTKRLLQQVSREISATTAFIQGMALQIVHHSAGERHVDALRAGGIRDRCSRGNRGSLPEPLLQLKNKILKK